jgi:hypothetical protein
MAKIVMGITTVADKTVATAGTRERLVAASTEVKNVTIQWHPSNAGNIYIGDVNVTATRGIILNASNPTAIISVDESESDEDNILIDLYDIYVDAATNGDKVKISYLATVSKTY